MENTVIIILMLLSNNTLDTFILASKKFHTF